MIYRLALLLEIDSAPFRQTYGSQMRIEEQERFLDLIIAEKLLDEVLGAAHQGAAIGNRRPFETAVANRRSLVCVTPRYA